MDPEDSDLEADISEEPVEIPIDGVLDLHMFSPKDVKSLVPEYIESCVNKGIFQLRIIHGKGTGTMRETVHGILKKHPMVQNFCLAGHDSGSWGATLVDLKKT